MISEAESWIYARLRHWRMISAPATGVMTVSSNDGSGGATTPGTDILPLPADMLDPYLLTVTASAAVPGNTIRIELKTPDEVIGGYCYNGLGNRVQTQPFIYYFDNSGIFLDSPPDQPYPYLLLYYQRPASLSAINATNFLTTYYPRLLRCAILQYATEWTKESGAGQYTREYWALQAMAELENAQDESDQSKRSAVLGIIQVGGGPPGVPNWSY